MKTQHLTIILFFTYFFSNVTAQEFKLGKVTIAELQEKSHPKDSSAVAAIIFKTGYVYFDDLTTVTEVKTKIKIYKKEGYDWANEVISHYISGENVSFQDAITYNLVDGKIEKTKLKSDGEFEQNINRYFSQTKITMPNVKEGSIIEFEYTISSGNFGSLRDWYFQSSIPVNYSEYKVLIPRFLTFNKRSKGFVFPKLTSESTYNHESSEVYKIENVPAMKNEDFVNNIDNYRASISHELAMVSIPGRAYKTFSTDWDSVTKNIYEESDFGSELNKTGYFEDDIKGILIGLNTKNEKIDAIFNFVKSKVKWNDYKGYSCDDGVKTAYKNKTGNVAEINLMLIAMLRYAEINTNPVLVSTRSNGIALFPSTAAFNYVIAAVETQDGLVLLDATEKFSTPNVLPFRALNWTGRLIRKDGTSVEVDLMPKTASNSTVMMSYAIDDKGGISGKIRRQKTDYEALIFRTNNENIKEDNYLEKLENEKGNIEISGYSRTNGKDIKLPVIENLSFSGANLTEIINGKIYVNPMLFFTSEQNPFKQETREYPVDYGYPSIDKFMINIQIPEGYKVEALPVSAAFTMEDNMGSFKYSINNSENGIQISIVKQINSAIIPSEYYSMVKEFYQGMITKENEKIILVKNQ
jgi:hypothetical protein